MVTVPGTFYREYTKSSIENYSKRWFEYCIQWQRSRKMKAEWSILELFFCRESKGDDLWGVTDHEFGHNWFPDCGI
jgi:hypothetical protein